MNKDESFRKVLLVLLVKSHSSCGAMRRDVKAEELAERV